MPQALAVVWEVVKSDLAEDQKRALVVDFNRVLGLGLDRVKAQELTVPLEITELVKKREALRKEKKFSEADAVRKEIENKGYLLEDTPGGIRVRKTK